ncbi:hypothetical protein N0V88_005594 [Collariella sp. IMI 366227]|nr:hypothetical protein N0V88_005594 [Collariella sp. IMI 366227]
MPPKPTTKGKQSSSPLLHHLQIQQIHHQHHHSPHPSPLPTIPHPFLTTLPTTHVYITHTDRRPSSFKRKIFLVPVVMNIAVIALFAWRMHYIAPYYFSLLTSAMGHANETTLRAADLTYRELAGVIFRRALTFLIDFLLGIFVWPWPWEFAVGTTGRGSPVRWRWNVGFRGEEVYVRRSRESWDKMLIEGGLDLFDEGSREARMAREEVLGRVRKATAPLFMQQKTGYLTMDGDWDLDWRGMVDATRLVDKKEVPLEALQNAVFIHTKRFGWVSVDLGGGETMEQDERRRQVMLFRDALRALGKENLFFRWVEMIQFETTQPGGFTAEKQIGAAQKIRDMFKSNGVDFDGLWKETVGTEGLAGMP